MDTEPVQTPPPSPSREKFSKRGPIDQKEHPSPKKRKLRMKEAISQLSCLFCIVGLNKKDPVECPIQSDTTSSKPTGSLKDQLVLSEGSSNYDDSTLTPARLVFHSDGGSPLEKQQQGESPTSIVKLFDANRFDDQLARLAPLQSNSTRSASPLSDNNDSPLASSDEARGGANKEAGADALELSAHSLPVKMRKESIYAKATTTRDPHQFIKHCKSADDIDAPAGATKRLRRIPSSIGRMETFDDMSEMGTLHPEDLHQVNGLVWEQNPDCANPGYYSGLALHGKTPHGKGFILFANGDTYQGSFHDGKMQGTACVYTSHNGTIFMGSFLYNLRHGHGETRVGSMVRYVGNYYHGVPHGYGEAFNVDGSVFHKGQFENGAPCHAYHPYIHQGDEASLASELIPIACDISLASTVGPMVSRYDENRTMLRCDDISVDSDDDNSCFSDLTDVPNSELFPLSSKAGAETTSTISLLAPMEDDHADLETQNLSLDPNDQLTAESLRLHTSSMVDTRRYQTLGPSFGRHSGKSDLAANDMTPASLYGRRMEL